ncbi:MAG TPA: S41 family peptidase [Thermoanaerobaculaceae bacterium]|nr:S41 family peptidase [Thermoanaerobaculaceae bacterium]
MRRTLSTIAAFLVSGAVLAVTPPMPRTPAPSPDGSRIAFSWQGDIWVAPAAGGAAQRITANPAYDQRPVWFPDGKRLAFTSDREGSDDVFVVDLSGGAPQRLTFHEAPDLVQGVLGGDVVFTSRRHEAWDRMSAVYLVPATGGTERLACRVLAQEAVPSPDGRHLALVRGVTPADRRHYRGAANRDLWLLELATGKLERLTSSAWDEDGVSWAGAGALVFRSDNGGPDRNLFRLDLATKKVTQLTHHEGVDVRAPRTSADGRLAAYELWDAIYVVPTDGSAAPRRLALDVPADLVEPPVERAVLKDDAEQVAVSPDGAQAALVVRGQVYVVARRAKDVASVAPAPTVRVTDTPARQRDLAWSPDGKTLVYASDRTGAMHLFAVRPADRDDGKFYRAVKFSETQLTRGDTDEHQPRFSPDGKLLAFVRGKGGLAVANADGTNPRTLFEHWERINFAWSPDSKWLAFAREDQEYNREVFIVPAAGGEAVDVSQHPGDDDRPAFSPDGRRLYWLSDRHERRAALWVVYLTRADHERTPEEWAELLEDEGGRKQGGKDGAAAKEGDAARAQPAEPADRVAAERPKEKPAGRPVAIDFDRIHERARMVTDLPGEVGEFAIAPDSRTIVFAAALEGERDLYKVRWDGKEPTRLTTGGVEPTQLSFSADGKTVLYRTGKGTVGSVALEGKPGDPTPFAARVDAARAATRAEVFEEAWRELDRWFGDPTFHGFDWKKLHDRYRPLALAATARRDFDDAVNLMLGELNASHMGFRPPVARERLHTGDLGVEVEPAPDGRGVTITEVLPDTPAARVDAGLAAGDRIVAVNGKEVGARDNFFAPLGETQGQRVLLRVAGAKGEREVALTAATLDQVRQARYRRWVEQRRAIADRLSGGRLGYIHIQGMDEPSLEEFERDLFAAAHGKQGLLIDVRNNGGGYTTDYLMAILEVRRHAWTLPRDGDRSIRAYPGDRLPLPAWTRPAAALCDSASYSNAEIFSWAFKTLKRGPLVGTPTFGAVYSTGAARLTDGSIVRLPSRAWFVAGSDVDEENHGCVPDFVVEDPPEQDLAADSDAQLAKAVEVLLAQLPKDPSQLPW